MPKTKINSIQINLTKETEDFLVETIISDFKASEEARAKKDYGTDYRGVQVTYNDRIKKMKDIYYGNRIPKVLPWIHCSNRSLKITMAIVEMLHAQMFPQVWNEDLIRWKPVERTDKKISERITKFMKWWIQNHTKKRNFFDKWVKTNLAYGDTFTETTWHIDYIDTGLVNETPVTDEFGIQLYEKDGTPSISKDKQLKVEERTLTEIFPKENVYFQEGQKDIYNDPIIIKAKYNYSDFEQMEDEGKAVNVSEAIHEGKQSLKDSLMKNINEFYGMSSLTNIDTLKEVKLQSTPVEVLKCYRKFDVDNDGFAEDIRIIIDPLNRLYLGGVAVKDISKRGRRPIDFTKINDYIDNPDGLEGYGFIEMVMPLAEEIDAIFNQVTDSNTLSILRPGFYDPASNLQPQNITMAPNKLIPVPDPSRNVYFPNIEIPVERLIVALRAVLEFIERLTGASSYVMGKESEIVGGSGTATRTQAIMMSAETRFAIPAQRLREGAGRILTTDLDLIQKNIPPGLETRILGEDDEPIFSENELTSDSIAGEFDAYLMEDPSQGSANAERQLWMVLYQLLLGNPLVAQDPIKLYLVTAQLLKAHGQDPEEYIGEEPDAAKNFTPEIENTMMVEGNFKDIKALPTQNHMEHISKHKLLLQSPTLAMLTPGEVEQITTFDQHHIQEHMMLMQQMMAIFTKFGGQNAQPGNPAGATQIAQGPTGASGVGNIPGPLGAMEATKEAGTSGINPSMQP